MKIKVTPNGKITVQYKPPSVVWTDIFQQVTEFFLNLITIMSLKRKLKIFGFSSIIALSSMVDVTKEAF